MKEIYTTITGRNRPIWVKIRHNLFEVSFFEPLKEIEGDDWFSEGLKEDEESFCCTVD